VRPTTRSPMSLVAAFSDAPLERAKVAAQAEDGQP
jgi:hypothetical protein